MKKQLLVLFLISGPFFSWPQSIAGSWQGILAAGHQKLRLVFHIKPDSGDTYRSLFDSPDQGALGIPCSETTIKNDSLEILIKTINGGYRGKWDKRNRVSGYYFQNGRQFPMDLSSTTDTAAALNRPQTPKPPFPYISEDLEYDNAASGIHYSGTITYPRSGGPFPSAILITGSGPQDRDESMFGHKPFAVIADYLTRRGYAVLRVDDRGIGKSTGDVLKATSRDFAEDVETGVNELRSRRDIDKKRIGLIGHSEGGLIAAITTSADPNISFIVMLAGPGLKGADLLALQNKAIALSHGEGEEMAEATKGLNMLLFHAVLFSSERNLQSQDAWKSFLSWKKNMNPTTVNSMGLSDEASSRKFLQAQLDQLNNPWLIYFLKTDPAAFIIKLQCKVLALNGSKDIQVLPDQNLAAIDSALKKSRVKIYSTEKLPGLNHLFQHCKTCTAEEYGKLEETFAPEALATMGDWLDKNVK